MNVYNLVLLIVSGILIFKGLHHLLKLNFGKSSIYGGVGLMMLIFPLLHSKAIDVLFFELMIVGALFIFRGMFFVLEEEFDLRKSTIYAFIGITMLAPVMIYVVYFLPMS